MREPVMIGPGGRQRQPRPLLRTTLGRILRHARREQGRTLADVAGAARVSMPYLSELERGRKEASSEVLAAVCDALRIELSDLLALAGRSLAEERARRALSEERARRVRERMGTLPADAGAPADDLPAVRPLDVPVVVPLDAVRRRGMPPGHRDGDVRASLAA
ncbi:MAG: helix-turn-helix transcriptional regulator [Streptosporangiaceae bacterium]|jgi:transcriptional regulator with XRE-family HTH domain